MRLGMDEAVAELQKTGGLGGWVEAYAPAPPPPRSPAAVWVEAQMAVLCRLCTKECPSLGLSFHHRPLCLTSASDSVERQRLCDSDSRSAG